MVDRVSLKQRGRVRIGSVVLGLLMGGTLGVTVQPADAVVESPIYRSPTLAANTGYGYGQVWGFKNAISCNGGPPFAASVYNKTPGGTIFYRLDGSCPLSKTFTETFTNFWCSNRTAYTQLGVCSFSRNV